MIIFRVNKFFSDRLYLTIFSFVTQCQNEQHRDLEAFKLEEQKRLELQMGAKRAKEEAERTYKDRLLMLEQEKREAERRERDEVSRKHDLIRNANMNEFKDDTNLVDEMFATVLPHSNEKNPQGEGNNFNGE
jgi:hypothetical protein